MESDHNNSMSLGIIKQKKPTKKKKTGIRQGMPSTFKDGDLGWRVGDRIWHDL